MALRIRVDDFPGTKPDEFDKHNLDSFKQFHSILKDNNVDYVLGVIPGYTVPKDLVWMKEQDNITVALHGVVHDESHQDEFYGKCYTDIEIALLTAKNYLESHLGYRVADYIPPHNTLNFQTVLVLSDLEFYHVYGGPETDDKVKCQIGPLGMKYIHSEPPLEYGRSDELMQRGAVEYLKEECKKRDVWLTLHSPWEINIGLSNLREFMMRLRDADVF